MIKLSTNNLLALTLLDKYNKIDVFRIIFRKGGLKVQILTSFDDFKVTGTLVWYYFICKREVWLMSRKITADQSHELLDIGRFIHENSYSRKQKEVEFDNMKFDVIENKDGTIIVEEIKKTSRFIESSRMQLLFYLYELYKKGIYAEGMLLFPEEKKREKVTLDSANKEKVEKAIEDILNIANQVQPPKPVKVNYCKSCAYSEFCWA